MKTNFLKAQRVLRTSRTNLHVIAVNGCCYGKDDKPEKEGYLKLCGQRFWTFLSLASLEVVEIGGAAARAGATGDESGSGAAWR